MRRMTNTFFIFTAFLAAISVASCNETPTPADPEIPDDKDIEGYFKASLSGADSLFGGNYKIRTDSVAENRDRVWGLWKEANGDFMEDKLPTPDDLVTSHEASHWTLPAELHALLLRDERQRSRRQSHSLRMGIWDFDLRPHPGLTHNFVICCKSVTNGTCA